MHRWVQSWPFTSGLRPGFVLEESILLQKSHLQKTRRGESWLPQCSGSQKCLQPPGRRICIAWPLCDLNKGGQASFSEPSTEGKIAWRHTGHMRVSGFNPVEGTFWSIITFHQASDTSLCGLSPSVFAVWCSVVALWLLVPIKWHSGISSFLSLFHFALLLRVTLLAQVL